MTAPPIVAAAGRLEGSRYPEWLGQFEIEPFEQSISGSNDPIGLDRSTTELPNIDSEHSR
jgi:hypothetical protein